MYPVDCHSLPLQHSPSYLLHNLSASPKYLAYVQNCGVTELLLVKPVSSPKANEVVISIEKDSTIDCFRYVYMSQAWMLVVLSTKEGQGRVQVYGEDGRTEHPIEALFPSGPFTAISNQGKHGVLLGHSSGKLYLLHKCSQTLQFYLEPNGRCVSKEEIQYVEQLGEQVVTIHDNTKVMLLSMKGQSLELQKTTTLEQGVTNLRMASTQNGKYILISNFNGQIIILSMENLEVLTKINSNLRLISGMDTQEVDGKIQVVVGGEDSQVNLWEWDGKMAGLLMTRNGGNQVVVGCGYLGDTMHFCVTAYEVESAQVYQVPR